MLQSLSLRGAKSFPGPPCCVECQQQYHMLTPYMLTLRIGNCKLIEKVDRQAKLATLGYRTVGFVFLVVWSYYQYHTATLETLLTRSFSSDSLTQQGLLVFIHVSVILAGHRLPVWA